MDKRNAILGKRRTDFPRMFQWLRPLGLVLLGARTAIAAAFARYADKREIEAQFPEPFIGGFAERDEVWLDFVADVGDGLQPHLCGGQPVGRSDARLWYRCYVWAVGRRMSYPPALFRLRYTGN